MHHGSSLSSSLPTLFPYFFPPFLKKFFIVAILIAGRVVLQCGLKVRGSIQRPLADHFLFPPALLLNPVCLLHPHSLPFSPLFSKSPKPSVVTSVLIHLFLLISSSAGKCFQGWKPNLPADSAFLNSSSHPSACCPCSAARAGQEEGRGGRTRPKKYKMWGSDPGKGMMLLNPRGLRGSEGGFLFFLLFVIGDCLLKHETIGSETHPDFSPHSSVAVWWGMVEVVADGGRREDSSVHPLPSSSPTMFKALTQFSQGQQMAGWFGPCSRRMDIQSGSHKDHWERDALLQNWQRVAQPGPIWGAVEGRGAAGFQQARLDPGEAALRAGWAAAPHLGELGGRTIQGGN